MVEGIRAAEWVVFEHSAHMAMIEEPDRYRDVVSRFLDTVESMPS
jgi:L-proline amide hydrolase